MISPISLIFAFALILLKCEHKKRCLALLGRHEYCSYKSGNIYLVDMNTAAVSLEISTSVDVNTAAVSLEISTWVDVNNAAVSLEISTSVDVNTAA